MSELKAYNVVATADVNPEVVDNLGCTEWLAYDKSDADKVIAELEERLKNSHNARKYWRKEYLIEYKECCSQKYKRCLAMAKWCNSEAFYAEAVENDDKRADWLGVWTDKWEKLAEKFKTN